MKSLSVMVLGVLIVSSCKTINNTSQIPKPYYETTNQGYTHEKMLASQRELAKKMETWPPEAIEEFKRRYIYKTITVITPTDTIVY